MVKYMIKMIMVAPYDDLATVSNSVFQEIMTTQRKSGELIHQYSFEVLQASATNELLSLQLDADVIIVRGAAAYELQRNNYHIPVVELTISSSDIVSSLLTLQEQYGAIPAGIVGSPNMLLGIEELAKHLKIDITPYILSNSSEKEVQYQTDKAISDGKQVIIGGQRGAIYAKNKGVQTIQIRSSKTSIANAIITAMQIGVISQQNRQVAMRNQALLDNAFEGLLALDASNRIRAYNHSAQEILGMPQGTWCLGVDIFDALHSHKISELVNNKEAYTSEIIEYNNTQISFKKIALFMRGEPAGSVLTFLNASQIQESEEILRTKLHEKRHSSKYSFPMIIGNSPALRNTINTAISYAKTDSNIMIYGESGTGKELFSQSIHTSSSRNQYPFVAINCSAIPETLLESELFGYTSGAFTGAVKGGKAGLFEQAHNGTIFLDEISEMPLSQQARLLRVLQEREITRLGSDKITPINVRIIAATNKNLQSLVSKGMFREDLYYRLCVLSLQLPPLRKRVEDIPLLVQSFLSQFQPQNIEQPLEISQEALSLLKTYTWPGNIRELKNFCERLAVLTPSHKIEASLVQELFFNDIPQNSLPPSSNTLDVTTILNALESTGGNKTKAAELLGINRSTLWRYLKQLSH